MGLFKSEEDKERERENIRLNGQLSKVRFFPGPIELYQSFFGYEVEVIDTGTRDKGVVFEALDNGPWQCHASFESKKRLVEAGIEALIECSYTLGGNNLVRFHNKYGLPVAKK